MQSITSRLKKSQGRPWPVSAVPISFVITDLHVGGAEKALTNLVERLDRSRWNPTVVCLDSEGPLAAILSDSGISVSCLSVDRRKPLRGVIRLASELSRLRPALVQSYLFHANLATKLVAPWAGSPWVVGGIRVAEHEKHWHLILERGTRYLSAGSVCVSREVSEFMQTRGGIPPDRLTVIPNGVEISPDVERVVSRASLGLPLNSKILLFVGRMVAQKGVEILIESFQRIAAEHPEWSLVLVGDGPLRAPLETGTHADPVLRNRVYWLGWRGDSVSIMSASDLLVLSSLWEGMPNVVLEAMALGLPVVATDVEGVADLVVPKGDTATGWIARAGDVESLTMTLFRAMGESDRFAILGRNGQNRVAQHFAWPQVVRAYEELWAGLLGYRLPDPES